jgi:prolyl-tRNA editing enzyme YbaK/EbsC (Cys-tRNA(Pro) deacylase)
MSKSLKRVCADAAARGADIAPRRLDDGTTTAQMAADALGVEVGQIAKSVVLRSAETGEHVLFLTAGDRQVDLDKAGRAAGLTLEKADAASIRAVTGFVIGGVSPFGHATPIRSFFDPSLDRFARIWAAAGTPHHVFEITPKVLRETTGASPADFTA